MADDEKQIPIGDDSEPKPARIAGVFDEAFLTGVEGVTEVLLIRHGQQDVTTESTTGEWIDPPLSEHGRQQARLLAASLSTVHFDHIFCSPLKRAHETAQPVAEMHRLEPEVVADLREVEIFRDLPPNQTARESVGDDLLKAVRGRMLTEKTWDVYPFSESSHDFLKRAVNAIELAIARNAGERIAIVCHGGVINAYMGHIIGSRYDMFYRPAHTSINVAAAGGDRRVLRSLNDVHHLMTAEGDFVSY